MRTSLILATALVVLLLSCNEQVDDLPNSTNTGIFPSTERLQIDTTSGLFNFPQFYLDDPDLPKLIYIAIFDEPISIEEQQIANRDAIIWEWNSSMEQVDVVRFENGVLLDSTYNFSEITCLGSPTLYWAAWAWDQTAQKIVESTTQQTFQLVPDQLPQLIVEQIDLVGEAEPDGYLKAGEQVTLKAVLKNVGKNSAENITITLHSDQQERTTALPIAHAVEFISPDQFRDVFFTFELPIGLGVNEVFEVKINLDYNDCLSNPPLAHELTITGKEICLYRITLVRIKTIPPGETWDHWLQIGFTDPDPYYILSEEGNTTDSIYSEVLQDVPPENLQQKIWSPLDPCRPLQLDKMYIVQVYDKDYSNEYLDNADDYMGDVQFTPQDFIDSNEKVHFIESKTLMVKLELEW